MRSDQSEPGFGEAEARVLAGDDQIASQDELKAAPVSDAVNGGDDHLGDLRMDQPPESLRRDDGQFALSERVDIHAGGKYRRLTGQADRAYRIVIIRLPQVTADQLGHLQVDGVLFLRPIEGDDRNLRAITFVKHRR